MMSTNYKIPPYLVLSTPCHFLPLGSKNPPLTVSRPYTVTGKTAILDTLVLRHEAREQAQKWAAPTAHGA
jgi:hypothetical protein